MERELSEATRILAKEATKSALKKVSKKKMEMAGTYVKPLKNGDFVEINPEKNDVIGRGSLT